MTQKRSIFEDVSADKPTDTAPRETGLIDAAQKGARGAIRWWLMALFALVALMIVIGGLTRLTDSGLSITEWNVVKGAVPPTNAAAWEAEFEKYRAIPEYQLQNKGMTLAEFKVIYWWEWGHRQLGRIVGLVWAIGFFAFLALRKIPVGWTGRLALLGVLGGVQGAIGWWMVRSGLEGQMLDVASYRLATHLGLAFVILALITWYILSLSRPERDLMQARRMREMRLQSQASLWLVLLFCQIVLGALVAGIDAGRAFVDWPLMGGALFPEGAFDIVPVWRNFFENAGLVQFVHRIMAYGLLVISVLVWRTARTSAHPVTRQAFTLAFAALCAQVVLGIFTVLNAAHWSWAIAHQILAIVLWVLLLRGRHLAQYPISQSIKGA